MHLKNNTIRDNTFADQFGQFGYFWADRYKGISDAFPSLEDIVQGLL